MGRPNVNVFVGGPVDDSHQQQKTIMLKRGVPFKLQVTESDAIYIIKNDFNLGGATTYTDSVDGTIMYQYTNPVYEDILENIARINEELVILYRKHAEDPEDQQIIEEIDDLESELQYFNDKKATTEQYLYKYEKIISVPSGYGLFIESKGNTCVSVDGSFTYKYIAAEDTDAQVLVDNIGEFTYTLMPCVNIPHNCTLSFEGGCIYGGCLIGNDSYIKALDEQIIFPTYVGDVQLAGTWFNKCTTPRWFGAKADSVTDDTKALQRTLDAGRDVCVVDSGSYRVESTLYINQSYQTIYSLCKNSRVVGGGNSRPGSVIRFAPADDSVILFKIVDNIHDIHFDTLNVRGNYSGVYIDCSGNYCDKDITITNCGFYSCGLFINFKGRGCTVRNSTIHGKKVFVGNWDDVYQSGSHPAANGQRAYIFENNRFHSIRRLAFNIQSGHARGLVFKNNIFDLGRGAVIKCTEEARNWSICNNTIQGMYKTETVNTFAFNFVGGIKNCIVSNNIVECDRTEWNTRHSDDRITMPGFLFAKNCTNTIISNNVLHGILRTVFSFEGEVSLVTISNNVIANFGRKSDELSQTNTRFMSYQSPTSTSGVIIESNTISYVTPDTGIEYSNYFIQNGSRLTLNDWIIKDNIHKSDVYFSGSITFNGKGNVIEDGLLSKGTTEERPSKVPVGFEYFDTTLGLPLFVKSVTTGGVVTWVKADGTSPE